MNRTAPTAVRSPVRRRDPSAVRRKPVTAVAHPTLPCLPSGRHFFCYAANMEATKASLRQDASARIRELSAEDRRHADRSIVRALGHLAVESDASSVLLYMALPDEVELRGLLDPEGPISAAGIRVFAPSIAGDGLEFRLVEGARERLQPGRFGIAEPFADAEAWSAKRSPGTTLVLCPGRAFATDGGRVGRGGGHYDRFLARTRSTPAAGALIVVGVCYEAQIFAFVPAASHDERMDQLVTENRRISTINA